MARYSADILRALDPDWRQREVSIVTFPAPPVLAKGQVYRIDGWSSRVFDNAFELFPGCYDAVMTNRGPAYLIRSKLGDLFSAGEAIPDPIYCATISFEHTQHNHPRAALIDHVRPIASSCHPASHTAIPCAPYLTMLLELSYLERASVDGFVLADHVSTAIYFANHDFDGNAVLDSLFRYMTISNGVRLEDDSCFSLHPSLSPRLRTRLIGELVGNENLSRQFPDYARYMHAVDVRNSLLKETSHASP